MGWASWFVEVETKTAEDKVGGVVLVALAIAMDPCPGTCTNRDVLRVAVYICVMDMVHCPQRSACSAGSDCISVDVVCHVLMYLAGYQIANEPKRASLGTNVGP